MARFARARQRSGERQAMSASAGRRANPTGLVSRARPATRPVEREAPALGEDERRHGQEQEQGFAVDGLQEEGHREDREVEHGRRAPSAPSLVSARSWSSTNAASDAASEIAIPAST